MSAQVTHATAGTELRALLREWRTLRGKSQLELALEAGVSQRHVSFIESGRSSPSREMLIGLAEALAIPFRERNALLLAGGFAPAYSGAPLDAAEMRCVKSAADWMIKQQNPYPAVLMDRYWNVISSNESAPRFLGRFIDIRGFQERTGRRNLLHLMFDPDGMRPFIDDWENVSRSLLWRVRREAVGGIIDEGLRELLDALAAYGGTTPLSERHDVATGLPTIPLSFVRGKNVLRYFSMVTTVGTAQTIASQELRIECLFPADPATEAKHAAFMDGSEEL